MEFPSELKYTKNDEWIKVEGDEGTIGITDFAQDQLSDIVYVEFLVEEGEEISKGDSIATLESVKAAADVYSPASGSVASLNHPLPDTPEVVNSDPYGEAWMVKITISDMGDLDDLLNASAYEKLTEEKE